MAAHTLRITQNIPVSPEKAWEFFRNPANLQAITPGNMGFNIISLHHGEQMYPGQLIEYRVSPVLGIPLYWMTEITHVRDQAYFVDEQRFGPYRFWHHQHHFKPIPGGVEMTDIVHYKLKGGFLGRLLNRLFVRKKLTQIFQYRFDKTQELFGSWTG